MQGLLGLRVDEIEAGLIVIAQCEGEMEWVINNMVLCLSLLLRTLVRQRANPGESLPEVEAYP